MKHKNLCWGCFQLKPVIEIRKGRNGKVISPFCVDCNICIKEGCNEQRVEEFGCERHQGVCIVTSCLNPRRVDKDGERKECPVHKITKAKLKHEEMVAADTYRTCTNCSQTLPLTSFGTQKAVCRACNNAIERQRVRKRAAEQDGAQCPSCGKTFYDGRQQCSGCRTRLSIERIDAERRASGRGTCPKCHQEKDVAEFSTGMFWCKVCDSIKAATYRAEVRDIDKEIPETLKCTDCGLLATTVDEVLENFPPRDDTRTGVRTKCWECYKYYHKESSRSRDQQLRITDPELAKEKSRTKSAEFRLMHPTYQREYEARTSHNRMRANVISASKSGTLNKLTREERLEIMELDCYYCAKPGTPHRNGIDKIDAMGAYERGNVVPACIKCNVMKGQLDPLTFVKRVLHIKQVEYYGECWPTVEGLGADTYVNYKSRAKTRGVVFSLSRDQFESIICLPCHYCRLSLKDHRGLDRKNQGSYSVDEVLPACTECNFMKNDMTKTLTYDVYFEHMEAIVEQVANVGLETFDCTSLLI